MRLSLHKLILLAGLAITAIVYWPGLYGGWLFDDYPNIVDNQGVQPHDASIPSLVSAALSSPSSEFKRPLASLSFAVNYLAGGLNPFGWKLTNLVIHLLNGALVFLLARMLLAAARKGGPPSVTTNGKLADDAAEARRAGTVAALIAAGWMLLPINLTGVLYVVQRMESLANLFVLAGLLGYVCGRQRMLRHASGGFVLATASLVVATGVGVLAKETAVMLPLYAAAVEWVIFRPRRTDGDAPRTDKRILGLFAITLVIPMVAGLAWLLPQVLSPGYWATRDFTLGTRLLTEARIVTDYIVWTLLPTAHALSFYHDDVRTSTGLFHPWTTLPSIVAIIALIFCMFRFRRRLPLLSLGIALYLGCHLLTGTILPLELVYEHRNYFASFGVLLAVVPFLAAPRGSLATSDGASTPSASAVNQLDMGLPLPRLRRAVLAGLIAFWAIMTAITALAWSSPLTLAQALAARAPLSPRAQYELGRTYIIYSHYDPASPFTQMAYAPLERAMRFPESSILPQQALIFLNARLHRPLKAEWWDTMIAKLKLRPPGVQDGSSLAALTQCQRDGECELPKDRMVQAFLAALSHPHPSARLLAMYGDYAWNVLQDYPLGLRMAEAAVAASPNEPAYHITVIRMLVAAGKTAEAQAEYRQLQRLNIGGSLDSTLENLQNLFSTPSQPSPKTNP
ncbi:tetratricopeptide repeat protein [Rhodanobacter sp. Si-c]|uniref:Tetratricopeptide repeat protein n=1 Tax=Rhodanobacter lycopersici TaxID=3162487 RepID=A0ABV3QCZ0_9GAMM